MSIEIIKERGKKEEIPLVGIGREGEIILPHTDPNRHYVWYTQTNFISPCNSPFERAIKESHARPIYKGGEINIILEKRA